MDDLEKITPRCLPKDHLGPCQDPLRIDKNGHSSHERIVKRVSGRLARGNMEIIKGIIIHQTDSSSSRSTLSYYEEGSKPNGAHFLIGKDGTITQTESMFNKTWHVGKLKSRCVAEGHCEPINPKIRTSEQEMKHIRNLSVSAKHRYEMQKKVPDRYPSNNESIGIELVGKAVGPDPNHPGELLFEEVTESQNKSLTWLVRNLSVQFGVNFNDVLRHPKVSYKTPSEASTAIWDKK